MKILTYIFFNKKQFSISSHYDEILKIHPGDTNGNGSFDAILEKHSPELKNIIERLENAGLTLWIDKSRPCSINEYGVRLKVKYDRKDFLKAPYLSWFPNHTLEAVAETDNAGQIILNLDSFDMGEVEARTKKALFAGALPLVCETEETLVSDTFRKVIEQAGLIGVQFEDRVKLTGDLAAKVPEKFWVIRSNVLLPPLSRQTKLVDKNGQPCGPDAPDRTLPTGEHLRYDASALAPLEPFDLGSTQGCKPTAQNALMSQRFYQLCLKHKIKLIVEPIEVMPS